MPGLPEAGGGGRRYGLRQEGGSQSRAAPGWRLLQHHLVDAGRLQADHVELAGLVFGERADAQVGLEQLGLPPPAIIGRVESPYPAAAEVRVDVGALRRRVGCTSIDVAPGYRAAQRMVVFRD